MPSDLGRSPAAADALKQAAGDADPLVRRAALAALEFLPPDARLAPAVPRLTDPVRIVRIEAARVLAPVRPEALSQDARAAYERAAAEFVDAQRANADRPESRTNLGTFFATRGRAADAEREFLAALALERTFVPAYVNLADLYRAQQREPDVRRVLEEALGLALVRAQQQSNALAHLERAAAREPDNARFVYTYAVALHSAGRPAQAVAILEKGLRRHPNDRDMREFLAQLRAPAR
jgi:Flp pilus assembly protein TadD